MMETGYKSMYLKRLIINSYSLLPLHIAWSIRKKNESKQIPELMFLLSKFL